MTNKPMLSVERELRGAIEQSLFAMKRIYQAGYEGIINAGSSCDKPGVMFENDPTVLELRALLDKPDHPCPVLLDGCDGSCAPAAQRQGEPVACAHEWTDDGEYLLVCTACEVREDYTQALQLAFELGGTDDGSYHLEAEELCEVIRRYAEQPTPVAVVMPERSSQDYAIEHAEYMAQAADDVLAKFQAYGLTLLAVDEGGDDGENELFGAIDNARSDLQESLVDLRGMVYEFRKRSNRCTSM